MYPGVGAFVLIRPAQTFYERINLSLLIARLNKDNSTDDRWHPRIQEEFTHRIDRRFDDILKFSFTLGKYLPNLYYLDRKWVENNIDGIFPKEVGRHWYAAFTGYLSNPTLYSEFYDILRSQGHYTKALQTTFDERYISERLIHHLCFAYLQGKENLGDPGSLFESMLTQWGIEVLKQIIMFFWMQHKDGRDISSQQKVLAVCQRIAEHYREQSQLSIDEKTVLSHLSQLSVYLDSLDAPALEWINLSAKYVDVGYDTPTFVEQLDRLADNTPREAGRVYIVMLDSGIYPDHEMSHILSCVDKLYVADELELANTICEVDPKNWTGG